MKRKIFFFAIALLLITSCIRKSSISDSELIDAKRAVVESQYAISYVDIDMYYSNDHSELYLEQLPYDLIMCKANDGYACYRFYENYLKISNSGKFDKLHIRKLDTQEQDFLLYILNKGASQNESYCRQYLYYYYKNGIVVEKDSLKADSISMFFPEGYFDNANL